MQGMDMREMRAFHIAATTRLEAGAGGWSVPSQSGDGTYTVAPIADDEWACTCLDHETRLVRCKHILAVVITIRRERGIDPTRYTDVVRVTYSQDWSAYNAAQCDEKRMFFQLLADMCASIPQPERPRGPGRPRLPLADMVYSIVARSYVGVSSRRFVTDMRDAADRGDIDHPGSFQSLLRYTKDPALTPVLAALVGLSALPLRTLETRFAVDSSGFGTTNTRTWFSTKHGREMRVRDWRKAHAMIGVDTHIVTAVEVTPSNVNDSPMLPRLAHQTAASFTIAEVSADKAYLSHDNVDVIDRLGATPYIPFKSNSVAPIDAPDGSPWARMWHLYSYRQDEFLAAYHQRSNVETVFSMVKAKFGDGLRSRTETGQDNEVYAKFIAHNLCVLIQSFYELGIDAEFTRA
ncbi:MAG TPA: transposase [Iamia sp.]|nr:transposase [Iamia sp.]